MWHARRGGPRTQSRTTDANLDCPFVENALLFVALKIGWSQAPSVSPLVQTAKTYPTTQRTPAKIHAMTPGSDSVVVLI